MLRKCVLRFVMFLSVEWMSHLGLVAQQLPAIQLPVTPVERQPLKANLLRLAETLDYLGYPLTPSVHDAIQHAPVTMSAIELQRVIDPYATFFVEINPELRTKVSRGPGANRLQQAGYTPLIVKIVNQGTVARPLRIDSQQAGTVYSGESSGSLERQAQTDLSSSSPASESRFLALEMYDQPPMTSHLSGLEVEYRLALIYSSETGKREATITFDIGEGTQDLGFRSEIPVLFDIQPAIPVQLSILDHDGRPTAARLEVRDPQGHVFPPQAKRLAPDFFFQPQVYRHHGDQLLLPPGEFELTSSRGPEYFERKQTVRVQAGKMNIVEVKLERWIHPMQYGFYCGDHHIHGAGCSHYDNPSLGVKPLDMFAQVKGEGLNVGCVLTWGPCFEHQRTFFSPLADAASEPLTVMKYDLEISGFGSAALGHVCLLNLTDQNYPGSEGSKIKGWPTWTVPVMRWAKEQGGVTGYPHSALHVDPAAAASWTLEFQERSGDGMLSREEAETGMLPDLFDNIDVDGDGQLNRAELERANDKAADKLPNVAFPAMNGGGSMEIFVSAAEGVCDFVSAMDTARIPEWNTWYHLMNCGLPLKLSGETDFPCMSSRRVGQGRVYVHLGEQTSLDFSQWCQQLAQGRSYVSDGYAHALEFHVDQVPPGEQVVQLAAPTTVRVHASVAFAPIQPRAVAYGTLEPRSGPRMIGDTVNLHAPRDTGTVEGGGRLVEVIVNGRAVASSRVPADGKVHQLEFAVPIASSSWIALRQFPQLHTNPVTVLMNNQPIRASRASAIWCMESIRRLWRNRAKFISASERSEARVTYQRTLEKYAQIAMECEPDEHHPVPLEVIQATLPTSPVD